MFGEAKTPTIAQGRVPLVLELLSPAQRPLQITRDLSAFWQECVSRSAKEMKGRYPKHVWPDDPANTANAAHEEVFVTCYTLPRAG